MTNTPFTYLIGWSNLNKWYYGVRYAKKCHPSDLWTTYFTSSPIVKEFVKDNGSPDVIQIRKTFKDAMSARLWEDKVQRRMNVIHNSKWLNRAYGNSKFDTTGHFCGVDHSGNLVWINKDDARVKTGEIQGNTKGKLAVRDKKGKTFQTEKTNPMYLSGELKSVSAGYGTAYNPVTKECIGRILLTDPRWGTGDIVGSPLFSEYVATEKGMISKTDPDYINGNIKHINSSNAPAMDPVTNLPLGRISVDDPRWKTGEIVSMSKDFIPAKDSTTLESLGNIHRNDPRWKTGEIIARSKGTVIAKCSRTGKSVGRVEKNDPRWLTKEIVGIRAKLSS